MEKKKTMDGYTQFAGLFAPLLSEQLRLAGNLSGELAPEASIPAVAEPVADPDQAADQAPDQAPDQVSAAADTAPADQAGTEIAITLRFEGALTGECCLVMPSSGARALGGEAGDPGSVLRKVLGAVVEPFAAALFAHYGTVHIHVENSETIPAGAIVIVHLSGTTMDGVPVLLTLHADGELQRGLPRLARVAAAAEASGIVHGNLGLVMDVELSVTLRFGQRQLSLRDVMDLASGSVVELDREVDEPVELILDGRVIARGEAVIVDGNYGVRVTEVLQPMVM